MDNSMDFVMYPALTAGMASGLVIVFPGCGVKQTSGPRDNYDGFALCPNQTHSSNVRVVKSVWDRNNEATDALVTFSEDVPIGVRTADCVPILLYAEDVGGAAAVHAGWKGSLEGILDNTLDVLENRGADLSKLKVAFGPSISSRNYEVDRELADRFIEAGFADCVSWPNGKEEKPHLDLQDVNIERLKRRGVRMENIKSMGQCTFDAKDNNGNYLFPSYRRDKGTTDRILTCISILNPDRYRRQKERMDRLRSL